MAVDVLQLAPLASGEASPGASFAEIVEELLQGLVNRLVAEHDRLLVEHKHVGASPSAELVAEQEKRLAAEHALLVSEQQVAELYAEKSRVLEAMGLAISADTHDKDGPAQIAPPSPRSPAPSPRSSASGSGSGKQAAKRAADRKPSVRELRELLQEDAGQSRSNKRSMTAGNGKVDFSIPEDQEASVSAKLPPLSPLSKQTSDEPRTLPSGMPSAQALKKRRNSAPTLAPTPESSALKAEIPALRLDPSVPQRREKSAMSLTSIVSSETYTSQSTAQTHMHPRSISHPRSASFSSAVTKNESIFGTLSDNSADGDFELLNAWENVSKETPSFNNLMESSRSLHDYQPFSLADASNAVGCCQSFLMRRMVMSPSSRKRVIWDLLSVAFISYDAAVIPLQFVRFPKTTAMLTIAWLARIFWTCDIPVTFLTALVRRNGCIESRPAGIAWHYATTWLLLDFAVILIDWLQVILGSEGDGIHVLQMIRMLRLLRLWRLQTILDIAVQRTRSEKIAVVATVGKSVFGIILMTHVIACCWVGLGRKDQGWVSQQLIGENARWDQYATAFHWSLTQFYGSMDVQPTNLAERFFAIAALFMGFVLATAFVSVITSSMTRLHMMTSLQTSHFKVLCRYLQDMEISRNLASRVQLNALHTLKKQQRNLPEEDVELLKFVSDSLKSDLHLEIFSPMLFSHPVLYHLQGVNPAVVRQICHGAVSTQHCLSNDVLFRPGEVPTRPNMFFVSQGRLSYSQDAVHFQAVLPPEWLCEHVLWTSWVYHGLFFAESVCQLVCLDTEAFRDIVGKCQTSVSELAKYAVEFLKLVNNSPNTRSDLGSSIDIRSLMVLAFPHAQANFFLPTLPDAPKGSWWKRRFSKTLEQVLPLPVMFGSQAGAAPASDHRSSSSNPSRGAQPGSNARGVGIPRSSSSQDSFYGVAGPT